VPSYAANYVAKSNEMKSWDDANAKRHPEGVYAPALMPGSQLVLDLAYQTAPQRSYSATRTSRTLNRCREIRSPRCEFCNFFSKARVRRNARLYTCTPRSPSASLETDCEVRFVFSAQPCHAAHRPAQALPSVTGRSMHPDNISLLLSHIRWASSRTHRSPLLQGLGQQLVGRLGHL
jgi:hypothetical protein